jgi:hypothetical protein
VNDFEAVAFVQQSVDPAITGNDVTVQFHSYPVGLHSKDFHERGESKGSGRIEDLLVSVNVEFHGFRIDCSVEDSIRLCAG